MGRLTNEARAPEAAVAFWAFLHGTAALIGYFHQVTHLAIVLGATAIMGLIEKRSFLAYGLAGRHPGRSFCIGFMSGFVSLSLLLMVLTLGGFLAFDE